MNAKYLVMGLIVAGGAAAATSVSLAAGGGPRIIGSWNGTNAYALDDTFRPVYASSLTSAGYGRRPGSIETDTDGFQCVELAVRYFHYRKGIAASGWKAGAATDMCDRPAPGVSRTSKPAPGDLVVLKANDRHVGTGSAGHVAIVTASRGSTISTFNQNWDHDRTAFGSVSRDDVMCFPPRRTLSFVTAARDGTEAARYQYDVVTVTSPVMRARHA